MLNKSLVRWSVHFCPQLALVYLDNAKAGSQTVKLSLWLAADRLQGTSTFSGNVESRAGSPFARDLLKSKLDEPDVLRRSAIFSVVRNPFVRALSAYIDKVAKRTKVRAEFASRFGLRTDLARGDLSFTTFLKIISTEPDELLDPSFRSQYMNLLLPFSQPHFIGRLEDTAGLATFLARHGAEISESRPHSTGSREKLRQHYTPEAVELVRSKYSDDFRLFGYSTLLEEADSFGSMSQPERAGADLIDWLAGGEPPVEGLDAAPRTFVQFETEQDTARKLALVQEGLAIEDNWARVLAYAEFAFQAGELHLCQSALRKFGALRAAHLAVANKAELFVPLPEADLEHRLAGQQSRLALKEVVSAMRSRVRQDREQKRRQPQKAQGRRAATGSRSARSL